LEEGVDGLVHISDLSWSKKIKHPAEFTKVGEMMDVIVLSLDLENRRLSLGHKQLEENPWDVFESIFLIGSIHEGTVVSVADKGAQVDLPYGVVAFCPHRHTLKEDGSMLKTDEKVSFKVIEFNRDSKKIVVSHTRTFKDELESEAGKEKNSTASAIKKINEANEKTTLGDIEALSNLKDAMEAEEAK
jgi:small subunit ribosomal protein S1